MSNIEEKKTNIKIETAKNGGGVSQIYSCLQDRAIAHTI
jgi:hypothetical protein